MVVFLFTLTQMAKHLAYQLNGVLDAGNLNQCQNGANMLPKGLLNYARTVIIAPRISPQWIYLDWLKYNAPEDYISYLKKYLKEVK